MVLAFVLSVGVLSVDAAYMHSVTLKQGSSGSQVASLQATLGVTADGSFGPMTKAAVVAFQSANGLVADGVVGPMTGAVLSGVPSSSNYLAGCTSNSGYSVTTGQSCAASTGTYPAGCTSNSGYSVTTGQSCAASTSYPAGCSSTVGYSPTTGAKCDGSGSTPAPTGALEGGAGSIEDADFVSSLTGEEVGEDAEDVKVAGLDIDADDGSDLRLTAVRLDFTVGDADQDFEDYASEVSLWFEGEEVARVDADAFNDDNNYDKTLSLDDGAVIKAGDTGQLVVAVTGIGNLDTNDVGETWTVEFESVRFEDASGAIITDNATGDINGVTRTFSFESFATSTDTELKIAEKTGSAADAINKSHMINSHPTEGTDNVKLLSFTLEAEGDSDIEIREFLADFIVTGATNVDGVIQGGTSPAARLFLDGEEYGTATYAEDADGLAVGVDEEIMWDDVNYTIKAGDKIDAYIEVDINDTTGTGGIDDLDEGDTILAQITATQRTALTDIDARDETGTQLAVADITGTATGEANQIYDVMFTLATSGWSDAGVRKGGAATLDDEVTYNLAFTVTAVDGDVYIDNSCTEDADGTLVIGDAPDGFNYSQTTGTLASIALTCSFTTDDATLSTDRWLVPDGQNRTFKVAVNAIADVGSSFVQVTLEGLGWSEDDEAGDRLFEGSLDDTYKSDSESLTMN